MHVTLKHMARPCSPGLTPRAILEKSTLHGPDLPTADRHDVPRHTQATNNCCCINSLQLPEQPMPRISA